MKALYRAKGKSKILLTSEQQQQLKVLREFCQEIRLTRADRKDKGSGG